MAEQEMNPKRRCRKKNVKSSEIISIFTSIISLILIVIIIYSFIRHFAAASNHSRTFTIDHKGNTFLMDGKAFRAVPEAWHKRLRSMRAAGLNAIDIYVEWSLHNPHDGVYHWSGMADVEKFIKLAQRESFYIILRPGPYICAERDNGGLPHWLFGKYPGIRLRTSDANYTHEVAVWYSKLMPRLQRFFYGNGGPIIMVQLENEYGSFGACDHKYMSWLRDETLKYVGDKAVLFTTDYPTESLECGRIDDVFVTIDFGINETHDLQNMWSKLRAVQPTGPLVNSEFYAGWLTHWHESNQRLDPQAVANALDAILATNANVNLYMFFGGTNFGFTAGANDMGMGKYAADITSYDYDALLDEWGNVTTKYQLVRDVIGKYLRVPQIQPVREQTYAYGKVDVKRTVNLLSREGREALGNSDAEISLKPKTFEELDQHSGLMLYETSVEGLDLMSNLLTINGLRDRALIYLDQEFVGILSRQHADSFLILNKTSASFLQILVENQGRINYNMANDTKGIMGAVTLQKPNGRINTLNSWHHIGYPLEEVDIKKLLSGNFVYLADTSNYLVQGPAAYYGEFVVTNPHHTFLNPNGWGKGVAYVNGFNLGRYWPHTGPQLTLYVPQEILVRGPNTLLLIEYEQTNRASIDTGPFVTLEDKPQLDN